MIRQLGGRSVSSATLSRRLARRRMASRVDSILPLELSKKTPMLEVRPGPVGKPNGPGLWHVKGMGFPPYFQNVRNALVRNGHSVSSASRITWGAIRRWARGGDNVHPEVRAAARRALASISGKEARAHAQHLAHAHATLRDQYTLRQFARYGDSLNFANPYHAGAGSGHGGQFTSAGNAGGGTSSPTPTNKKNTKSKPPAITPKQKAQYLQLAAQDHAKAQQLRAQAAKLNQQIAALSALIAQEQKYLATAATGQTTKGSGTQTGSGSGTSTGSGSGTQTQSTAQQASQIIPGAQTLSPSQQQQAIWTQPTTQQMLAQNQVQLKQLTAKRDQLVQQANVLDQQSARYTQLANG